MSRRRIGLIAAGIVVLLLLPMPIAERYTSPTQDGQYIRDPALAYSFVLAAARVTTSAELNTSGEALRRAKDIYETSDATPVKVELLFLPDRDPYSYTTRDGGVLTIEPPGDFVWEVWGLPRGEAAVEEDDGVPLDDADVVGYLDYISGDLLDARPSLGEE